MTRKLLIFGNGLGMALDPDHFLLKKALEDTWQDSVILNDEQKRLISMCTGKDQAPEGEHELDKLHLAISACEILNKIGSGDIHWLTRIWTVFPIGNCQIYSHGLQSGCMNIQTHYRSALLSHWLTLLKILNPTLLL